MRCESLEIAVHLSALKYWICSQSQISKVPESDPTPPLRLNYRRCMRPQKAGPVLGRYRCAETVAQRPSALLQDTKWSRFRPGDPVLCVQAAANTFQKGLQIFGCLEFPQFIVHSDVPDLVMTMEKWLW